MINSLIKYAFVIMRRRSLTTEFNWFDAGAIAAGNTVILKPSEVAHHTATVILKHVPRYLDSVCIVIKFYIVGTSGVINELMSYYYVSCVRRIATT